MGMIHNGHPLGVDSVADEKRLRETLEQIDGLTAPSARDWATRAPAPGSEIRRLEQAVPQEPVDLSHSLNAATIAALDALTSTASLLCSDDGCTEVAVRALTRSALMGASRLGYVVLPTTAAERERNAATVVAREAESFKRALKAVKDVNALPIQKPTDEESKALKRQIALHKDAPGFRDGAMIERSAELLGAEIERQELIEDGTIVADQLSWLWHTASGSAHGFNWETRAPSHFVADLSTVATAAGWILDVAERAWTGPLEDPS